MARRATPQFELLEAGSHGKAVLSDRESYVPDPDFFGEDRASVQSQ